MSDAIPVPFDPADPLRHSGGNAARRMGSILKGIAQNNMDNYSGDVVHQCFTGPLPGPSSFEAG